MSERRTVSSTGGAKGVKPQRYSLLPKPALDAISEVLAYGAAKYTTDTESGDYNWRKRYEWSKSHDAMGRHLYAHINGETIDPESGLPHIAHLGAHVCFLLTWLSEGGEAGEFDDRYRPGVRLRPESTQA